MLKLFGPGLAGGILIRTPTSGVIKFHPHAAFVPAHCLDPQPREEWDRHDFPS